MAIVESVIEAPRDDVFAVLSNGWTYSDWVVGTAHIRAVDEKWPQPGAVLHHTAGPWPLSLTDQTVSIQCEPPGLLVLEPHLWPLGEVTVRITLEEQGPQRTLVGIHEDVRRGPVRWLRTAVNDVALHYRNRESLRRLGDLARRRKHPHEGDTVGPDAPPSAARRQAS